MNQFPNFDIENEIVNLQLTNHNSQLIAGVDEAGRGPLCGPVVAAAVVIGNDALLGRPLINDSKKMTARQREIAFDWIMENCAVGVGICSPAEIDEINILQATMTAMKRAVNALPQRPDFILIDGNRMPDVIVGQAVVNGDSKSISIAAASIIAKQTRDKIMNELSKKYPEYEWDKNAGYPTPAHLQAIKKYGINEHYRKTYKPVREIIQE